MNTLLTINAGSSSLKFSVWTGRTMILSGNIEQIGSQARITIGRTSTPLRAATLPSALAHLRIELRKRNIHPQYVAHRIVHGGPWFTKPTLLTKTVLQKLQSIRHFAPLHLPNNVLAIKHTRRFWPKSEAWGVFDTALYHQLPLAAQTYPLPTSINKKLNIRKYGFHGTSHAWAWQQAAKKLDRATKDLTGVSIHLGAGSSLTRWVRGRVVDTSMGFTPLAGVPMLTRTGDLDPMLPLFLQRSGRLSLAEVEALLNRQSGLRGLSGLDDMRNILQAAGQTVPEWPRRHWSPSQRQRARLALDVYIYGLQRYTSMYLGLAPRPNLIVFTGAIGQNRTIQKLVLTGLGPRHGVRVVTIPTDEERAIAAAVQHVIH